MRKRKDSRRCVRPNTPRVPKFGDGRISTEAGTRLLTFKVNRASHRAPSPNHSPKDPGSRGARLDAGRDARQRSSSGGCLSIMQAPRMRDELPLQITALYLLASTHVRCRMFVDPVRSEAWSVGRCETVLTSKPASCCSTVLLWYVVESHAVKTCLAGEWLHCA